MKKSVLLPIVGSLFLLTSGCTYAEVKDFFSLEDNVATAQREQVDPAETPPAKAAEALPVEPRLAEKKEPNTVVQTHTLLPAGKGSNAKADVALGWLKNGNTRFRKGFLRKDGQSKKDVIRLSAGQKPHTIVLSCSDSRVPPEIIFDQKLGEIFVVRTAGEVLEPTSIASIEYAVEHLDVHNLLVMGHTQCGAVKAALGTLEGQDAGSPHLNKLVADIHPRISAFKGKAPSSDYSAESWANVNGVVQDLTSRSKILDEKVRTGELKISGSLYHLDSGVVDFAK